MSKIDYKQKVKEIYPNARMEQGGFGYIYVVDGEKGLGHAFVSETPAWKSAYERLKQENKHNKTINYETRNN